MRIISTRDLAAVARGRRRNLGLSQEELARRAGVSRQWLGMFERGKRTAELGLAIRLLDTLGLDLDVRERNETPPSAGSTIDLDRLLEEYQER
jgi:transcriptional regulator with XRE-family HTH domain